LETHPPEKKTDWSNVLIVLAIAVPLAIGAFKLYQKFSQESEPGEGGLVVNINTATEAELEKIPGVGPSLATKSSAAGHTRRSRTSTAFAASGSTRSTACAPT
jgi:hypothetical protein